ncbi:MAG: hypothetical protein AAFO04_25480 [Cyanobacteria bacterium J06592_8]
MRKFMVVFALGLLTIWTGGCGSQDQGNEPSPETPTAESSPEPDETADGETEPTNEEEIAEESEEESEKEAFEEPLVEQQKEETAAKAGLIQSTKPEERLRQLKGSTNGDATAAAPATTPSPSPNDPFSVLQPQVVQRTPDPEEAAESLNLTARTVPTIPDVPIAATPPQWTVAAQPQQAVGPQAPGTGSPNLPAGQIPPIPGTPGIQRPPQAGTGIVATSPTPGTPPNGQAGRPGQPTPGQQASPQSPQLPDLAVAQVPSLPELPPAQRPAQAGVTTARRPGTQPATPGSPATPPAPPKIPDLPVAQVPNLPELPQSEPLPRWRDPNAPPPTAVKPTPVLPPPPSIDIAKAIAVTGVMRVGDETRVILKAPTEPTSRYVSVGQKIANGQVLVKRVKFNVGSDPIVIFEQNGREVAIEVGQFESPEDGELNLVEPSTPRLNGFTAS